MMLVPGTDYYINVAGAALSAIGSGEFYDVVGRLYWRRQGCRDRPILASYRIEGIARRLLLVTQEVN